MIRNQADIDKQLLLGQAEHHCSEVKRVLTEQAQQHVAGVEQQLYKNCAAWESGLEAEARLKEEAAVQ